MAFSPHHGAVPLGHLLAIGARLADDRVPREGRRVMRERVLVRWSDGTVRTWTWRRSTIGRGEGSSGLRFDVAEPTA